MRTIPRRSFTVEAKSGGRRVATVIPARTAAPDTPLRRSGLLTAPAPSVPAAEPRRILPSLIVPAPPQVEAAPMPDVGEPPARRSRGRPRKQRPVSVEPVVDAGGEFVLAPVRAPQEPVRAVQPVRLTRLRREAPALDLPRGERWKRRLGRWSR